MHVAVDRDPEAVARDDANIPRIQVTRRLLYMEGRRPCLEPIPCMPHAPFLQRMLCRYVKFLALHARQPGLPFVDDIYT